jgi:hypothetical protein
MEELPYLRSYLTKHCNPICQSIPTQHCRNSDTRATNTHPATQQSANPPLPRSNQSTGCRKQQPRQQPIIGDGDGAGDRLRGRNRRTWGVRGRHYWVSTNSTPQDISSQAQGSWWRPPVDPSCSSTRCLDPPPRSPGLQVADCRPDHRSPPPPWGVNDRSSQPPHRDDRQLRCRSGSRGCYWHCRADACHRATVLTVSLCCEWRADVVQWC